MYIIIKQLNGTKYAYELILIQHGIDPIFVFVISEQNQNLNSNTENVIIDLGR